MFGQNFQATTHDLDNLLKLAAVLSDPKQVSEAGANLRSQMHEIHQARTELEAKKREVEKATEKQEAVKRTAEAAAEINQRRHDEIVRRTKAMETEFARLAAEQTKHREQAKAYAEQVAQTERRLEERLLNANRRQQELETAERKVAELRDDLQTRLDLIKRAAA